MARRRIGNEWVEDPTEEVAVAPKKATKSKAKVKKSDEEQPSESD